MDEGSSFLSELKFALKKIKPEGDSIGNMVGEEASLPFNTDKVIENIGISSNLVGGYNNRSSTKKDYSLTQENLNSAKDYNNSNRNFNIVTDNVDNNSVDCVYHKIDCDDKLMKQQQIKKIDLHKALESELKLNSVSTSGKDNNLKSIVSNRSVNGESNPETKFIHLSSQNLLSHDTKIDQNHDRNNKTFLSEIINRNTADNSPAKKGDTTNQHRHGYAHQNTDSIFLTSTPDTSESSSHNTSLEHQHINICKKSSNALLKSTNFQSVAASSNSMIKSTNTQSPNQHHSPKSSSPPPKELQDVLYEELHFVLKKRKEEGQKMNVENIGKVKCGKSMFYGRSSIRKNSDSSSSMNSSLISSGAVSSSGILGSPNLIHSPKLGVLRENVTSPLSRGKSVLNKHNNCELSCDNDSVGKGLSLSEVAKNTELPRGSNTNNTVVPKENTHNLHDLPVKKTHLPPTKESNSKSIKDIIRESHFEEEDIPVLALGETISELKSPVSGAESPKKIKSAKVQLSQTSDTNCSEKSIDCMAKVRSYKKVEPYSICDLAFCENNKKTIVTIVDNKENNENYRNKEVGDLLYDQFNSSTDSSHSNIEYESMDSVSEIRKVFEADTDYIVCNNNSQKLQSQYTALEKNTTHDNKSLLTDHLQDGCNTIFKPTCLRIVCKPLDQDKLANIMKIKSPANNSFSVTGASGPSGPLGNENYQEIKDNQIIDCTNCYECNGNHKRDNNLFGLQSSCECDRDIQLFNDSSKGKNQYSDKMNAVVSEMAECITERHKRGNIKDSTDGIPKCREPTNDLGVPGKSTNHARDSSRQRRSPKQGDSQQTGLHKSMSAAGKELKGSSCLCDIGDISPIPRNKSGNALTFLTFPPPPPPPPLLTMPQPVTTSLVTPPSKLISTSSLVTVCTDVKEQGTNSKIQYAQNSVNHSNSFWKKNRLIRSTSESSLLFNAGLQEEYKVVDFDENTRMNDDRLSDTILMKEVSQDSGCITPSQSSGNNQLMSTASSSSHHVNVSNRERDSFVVDAKQGRKYQNEAHPGSLISRLVETMREQVGHLGDTINSGGGTDNLGYESDNELRSSDMNSSFSGNSGRGESDENGGLLKKRRSSKLSRGKRVYKKKYVNAGDPTESVSVIMKGKKKLTSEGSLTTVTSCENSTTTTDDCCTNIISNGKFEHDHIDDHNEHSILDTSDLNNSGFQPRRYLSKTSGRPINTIGKSIREVPNEERRLLCMFGPETARGRKACESELHEGYSLYYTYNTEVKNDELHQKYQTAGGGHYSDSVDMDASLDGSRNSGSYAATFPLQRPFRKTERAPHDKELITRLMITHSGDRIPPDGAECGVIGMGDIHGGSHNHGGNANNQPRFVTVPQPTSFHQHGNNVGRNFITGGGGNSDNGGLESDDGENGNNNDHHHNKRGSGYHSSRYSHHGVKHLCQRYKAQYEGSSYSGDSSSTSPSSRHRRYLRHRTSSLDKESHRYMLYHTWSTNAARRSKQRSEFQVNDSPNRQRLTSVKKQDKLEHHKQDRKQGNKSGCFDRQGNVGCCFDRQEECVNEGSVRRGKTKDNFQNSHNIEDDSLDSSNMCSQGSGWEAMMIQADPRLDNVKKAKYRTKTSEYIKGSTVSVVPVLDTGCGCSAKSQLLPRNLTNDNKRPSLSDSVSVQSVCTYVWDCTDHSSSTPVNTSQQYSSSTTENVSKYIDDDIDEDEPEHPFFQSNTNYAKQHICRESLLSTTKNNADSSFNTTMDGGGDFGDEFCNAYEKSLLDYVRTKDISDIDNEILSIHQRAVERGAGCLRSGKGRHAGGLMARLARCFSCDTHSSPGPSLSSSSQVSRNSSYTDQHGKIAYIKWQDCIFYLKLKLR